MWQQDAQGNWTHPVWGTIPANRLGGMTPQQIFGTVGDTPQAVQGFQTADRTLRAFEELQNADQQFNPDEGAGTAGSPYFANAEWDELLPRDVLDNSTFNPMYDFQNQLYGDGLWSKGLAKVMPGDPNVKDWSKVYVDPTFGLVTQNDNASSPSSMFDLVKDWATTFGPFVMPAVMGMTPLGGIVNNAVSQIPGVSDLTNLLGDLGQQITGGLDSLVGNTANTTGSAVTTGLGTSAPVTPTSIPDMFSGVTDAAGQFGGMSVNPSMAPPNLIEAMGLPAAPAAPAMSMIPGTTWGTAAPFLEGVTTGLPGAVGGGAPGNTGGMTTAELDALTAADPTAAGTAATNNMLSSAGIAAGGASGLDGILSNLTSAQGIGNILSTVLGAYGSNQLQNSLENIANQARADREPYRQKSLEFLNNPAAFYGGPMGQELGRSTANALSANFGNLFDSPTGQATMMQAMLPQYMGTVTSLGNLGLGGQSAIMQAQTNAANAGSNVYNAIGSGISNITNPQPSIMDILRQVQSMNRSGAPA